MSAEKRIAAFTAAGEPDEVDVDVLLVFLTDELVDVGVAGHAEGQRAGVFLRILDEAIIGVEGNVLVEHDGIGRNVERRQEVERIHSEAGIGIERLGDQEIAGGKQTERIGARSSPYCTVSRENRTSCEVR